MINPYFNCRRACLRKFIVVTGIILFLRLGWSVGQIGLVGVGVCFLIGEVMSILTVLSFSAIVTNGRMEGGGSYFMISRSLGPEFGLSIGFLFYMAYAVNTAFFLVGFAEAVFNFCQVNFEGLPHLPAYADEVVSQTNWQRLFGSLGLLFIFCMSLMGAPTFSKLNMVFFCIQYAAIIVGTVSYLIPVHHQLGKPVRMKIETRPEQFININLTYTNDGFTDFGRNFFDNLWLPGNHSADPWYPSNKEYLYAPGTCDSPGPGLATKDYHCNFFVVFGVVIGYFS